MKRNAMRTVAAAFALLAVLAMGSVAQAQQDPGPAAYDAALKGKRVVLIPMAMGFDLAQGWAYYLKREVNGFGGTFETRDPNWVVDAGAQAITGFLEKMMTLGIITLGALVATRINAGDDAALTMRCQVFSGTENIEPACHSNVWGRVGSAGVRVKYRSPRAFVKRTM